MEETAHFKTLLLLITEHVIKTYSSFLHEVNGPKVN